MKQLLRPVSALNFFLRWSIPARPTATLSWKLVVTHYSCHSGVLRKLMLSGVSEF
jgi:hypothetical protein